MKNVVAIASFIVAALSGGYLVFSIGRALRDRRSKPLRHFAILTFMIFGLWQAYALEPAPTRWLLYFCAPAGFAGILLIFVGGLWNIGVPGPKKGPDRRIPAMSMRLPSIEGCEQTEGDEVVTRVRKTA